MKKLLNLVIVAVLTITSNFTSQIVAQDTAMVTVTIENISPDNGVALTPVWVGFHSGSFDSYNGGLRSQRGLERLAEDGNTNVISRQFNNFNQNRGGLTYVDNSGAQPRNRLVRTFDLSDQFRQDATLGGAPLLPGDIASETFELRSDGSNDFFSYASMVLPTNDYFVANGNPTEFDLSEILTQGGEISFFIGIPNSGVNDAGTERNNFARSAGNGLFPGRNLPVGQTGPNQGRTQRRAISNVVGNPFGNFQNRNGVDLSGLDFNQYENGIGRVTITAEPFVAAGFVSRVRNVVVDQPEEFLAAAVAGELYFNVHTADFPQGEIRGQLDTVLEDETRPNGRRTIRLEANLDSAQEPDNASDSSASGRAIVRIVVRPNGQVRYTSALAVRGIAVSELIPVAIFSAIHIHEGPRGVNGPVLQDFIVDAGGSPDDFSVLEEFNND